MPRPDLTRLNVTEVGHGPWKPQPDIPNRAVRIVNSRSAFYHNVYYGTRTKRTLEDAQTQAVAMCAVLNALGAKRP